VNFAYKVTGSNSVDFYGIAVDANGTGNYIVTGTDNGNQTCMMDAALSPSSHTYNWGETYPFTSQNGGYSVFAGPSGVDLSVGYSYNGVTSTQPNIMAVKSSNGHLGELYGCYADAGYVIDTNHNDRPDFSEGTGGYAVRMIPEGYNVWALCGYFDELCSSYGSTSYPEVIKKEIRNDRDLINIYPNPVADNLNIDLNASEASEGIVKITDIQGKEALISRLDIGKGGNHFDLDISSLKPGIYFVKVICENNTVYPISKITKY